jgi:hypothetical protein
LHDEEVQKPDQSIPKGKFDNGEDQVYHMDGLGRLETIPKAVAADLRKHWYLNPSDGRLKHISEVQKSAVLKSHVAPAMRMLDKASGMKRGKSGSAEGLLAAYFTLPFLVRSSPCVTNAFSFQITFNHAPQIVWPSTLDPPLRNSGLYDPVRYRDWYYADVARNPRDNEDEYADDDVDTRQGRLSAFELHHSEQFGSDVPLQESITLAAESAPAPLQRGQVPERSFGPRRLCFIDHEANGEYPVYKPMLLSEWKSEMHKEYPEYVFVSYTAAQLFTRTRDELVNWPLSADARNDLELEGQRNRDILTRIGAEAARHAGVPAFWVDFESGSNMAETTESQPEVYAICDILRAAHSMIIVRGPLFERDALDTDFKPRQRSFAPDTPEYWLAEWGAAIVDPT